MNIIWSALAIEDLNEIEEFIAKDNPPVLYPSLMN